MFARREGETVRVDSLKHELWLRDSVIAAAATRSDHITLQPPPAQHDVFDVLELLVTIVATFVAARYGAEAGVRGEWRQRKVEMKEEEDRQRKRLERELERDATTVAGIAASIQATNRLNAIIKATPGLLAAMCTRFEARRNAVTLIEDEEAAHSLERFYEKLASLERWLVSWNEAEDAMVKKHVLSTPEHALLITTARNEFATTAHRALELVNVLRGKRDPVDIEAIVAGHIEQYRATHPHMAQYLQPGQATEQGEQL